MPILIQPEDRFVAHLDMLGMKELTLRNPELAWEALSKLTQARNEILSLDIAFLATAERVGQRVACLTFSDTILLFSQSDSRADAAAIVIFATEILSRAFHYSIPVRGGIAHGRFRFNLEEGIFAGPPLVHSYLLGEGAQWLGIVLDSETARIARLVPLETRGRSVIIDWPVPRAEGPPVVSPIVDWVASHRENFTGSLPIAGDYLYRVAFEQLFGPFADLPPRVQAKYLNTADFMNQRLLDP